MINNKKYKHLTFCGTGSTEIILLFGDNKFVLDYKSRWMGSDEFSCQLTGKYQNNGNNYYFFEAESFEDKLNSSNDKEKDKKLEDGMVTTEADESNDKKLVSYLTFEMILLSTIQEIYPKDSETEFLICANGAIFNNCNGPMFDAIIFSKLDRYADYCIDNSKILKNVYSALSSVIKLLRIPKDDDEVD